MTTSTKADEATQHVDAVVIGAGFCGLYAVKRLVELGLTLRAFDAGKDVGGVWNWNRYPGAQTDSPHHTYRFTFAEDLLEEWDYSHYNPGQPEVLAYLRHVADRYDLRRHYTLSTRVESAVFDEAKGVWTFTTDAGERVTATYFVTGMGLVSAPVRLSYPGMDTFRGEILHTTSWPQDHDPDLAGKRIALIGTGSSGIQIMPHLAAVGSELTVYQRTPNYVVPTANRPTTDEDRQEIRERYDDVRRRVRNHPSAFPFEESVGRTVLATPPEEREEIFERYWKRGGFSFLYEAFDDVASDPEANAIACEFLARKIAEIVKDPETAATLTPNYPYGAKRPPTGDGYYEAFNLPHVSLVDLRKTPILEVTPTGIVTDAGEREVDVIVFATGFDALTGAFTAMDIRGRGGVSISDVWADGPQTYLGVGVAGFPNMFMIAGPQSPFSNLPPGAEMEGDWVVGAIAHMREAGVAYMEPDVDAQKGWVQHVNEIGQSPILAAASDANSWFTGANIEGKAKAFGVYFGGAKMYGDKLDEEAAAGYPGFRQYSDLMEIA
jgi:cyclohexanone monooxygenase